MHYCIVLQQKQFISLRSLSVFLILHRTLFTIATRCRVCFAELLRHGTVITRSSSHDMTTMFSSGRDILSKVVQGAPMAACMSV